MADFPTELIDALENLVDERFNELVAANKLDVTAEATNLQAFEDQMMQKADGDEPITQGFFRVFLQWLNKYYSYIIDLGESTVLNAVRYIAPVDIAEEPDCEKILVPFANLVIEGAGIEPTVPDPYNTTPNDVGFDPTTHLMIGGLALNHTDNKWYYRSANMIYELKDSLGLVSADISDFETSFNSLLTPILADYVVKVSGKELSDNNLTDALVTSIGDSVSHINIENIHLPPDGTTIEQTGDDALGVIPDAIIDLFSATLPLSLSEGGVISLAIDDTKLEVSNNKLSIPVASASVFGVIKVGSYLTIDGNGVLNGQAGGTGTGGVWGAISGTIASQTDLMALFNLKANLASPTFSGTVTMSSSTIIPNGGTLGQVAGPLLTFDDTNNYLNITGCNIGMGGCVAPTVSLQVSGTGIKSEILQSVTAYSTGFFGDGYKIIETAGETTAEIDNLIVRKLLRAYTMEVDQIDVVGGSLIVSPASGMVYSVSSTNLYFDTNNNSNPIQFKVNDYIGAQQWVNYDHTVIASYRGRVTAVHQSTTLGSAYIETVTVSGTPWVGMKLSQLGSSSDTARQNLLYLTSSDTNNPFIEGHSGVTDGTFSNTTRKFRLGNLVGITDPTYGELTGFGLYAQNVYLTGWIKADTGLIGGWAINSTYLAKDTGTNNTSSGMSPTDYPFYAGKTYAYRATAPFRVLPNGRTYIDELYIGVMTYGYIPYYTAGSGLLNSKMYEDGVGGIRFDTASSFTPPVKTTAERNLGTPTVGMIIFNTNYNELQIYTASNGWRGLTMN